MTLSELLTAYADGGGTLTGEALRRSVQEAWPLMLLETRNRVLGVDPESETGEAVRQCFDAAIWPLVSTLLLRVIVNIFINHNKSLSLHSQKRKE